MELISRQAAIDAINASREIYSGAWGKGLSMAVEKLRDLPSVQPEISMEQIKIWLDAWEGYIDKDIIERMKYRVIDIPLVNVKEVNHENN